MKNFTLPLAVVILLSLTCEQTYAQMQGQIPLNPKNVPQFVDPLPHFAGQRVDASGGNLVIRYVPGTQVAVSSGTVLANGTVGVTPGAGVTNLWTYQVSNGGPFTPPFWPAFTIEAKRGTPVNVTYENKLDNQTYASVNLVADQTLHWADPGGDGMSMSMLPYDGPVPVVPHLHGGEVPSESDGGPDAWFTPGLNPLKGPSWDKGVDEKYYYPNDQEAATLWYHDHALGVTRLNVYAGLAGFYFLRDESQELDLKLPGWSGDDLVQEVVPPGKTGVFAPQPYLPEIEIVFQDRMFDTEGKLYFPNLAPNPMIHPFWAPEFLGDIITVNGKTWPYLSVAPRSYRFRMLNGSSARFYEIWLQDLVTGATGPQIVQIGTDGGFLDAPVPIVGKLLLAPGERADVVINFAGTAGKTWTLRNSANAPFPKGSPPNGATTGRLMQFIVNGKMVSATNGSSAGTDKGKLPASLRPTPLVKLTNFAGAVNTPVSQRRQLTLNEVMGMGGPLEVLVNNTLWDGNGHMEPGLGVTEEPVEGTTELWQIINLTADAHPIHLHLVQFQLVSRQKFNLNNYNKAYNTAFGGVYVPAVGPPLPYNTPNADMALGGNPAVTAFLQGPVNPALPNERGWKDTYIVYPGEVTTFAVRFAPTRIPLNAPESELVFSFDPGEGPGYVWHCHIIDHEDNEMMRPYTVVPSPARTSLQGLAAPVLKSENANPLALDLLTVNEVTGFALDQNYPNPVTDQTEIRFTIPENGHVKLTVFDQQGRQVKVILDSDALAGLNTVKLDTRGLQSGIYFYQLKSGVFSDVKKMVIR
jgi:spore coat protein A, manganese oxidase